jgi:aspartate racemase
MLGVLGGMGPLATADFLAKLIAATPAERDEDHIPVVVYSVPQVPDRPSAITGTGPTPLPAMLTGVRTLKNAGVQVIAIACNTAYYWHKELEREGGVRILHIADAACLELGALVDKGAKVGLMATDGTLAAAFYQQRLKDRGYQVLLNTPEEQAQLVLPAIRDVKRNDVAAAGSKVAAAVQRLEAAGAQAIVLACTELPLALDRSGVTIGTPCVDTTAALARACVRWWKE